ncbi:MlaE family ABC transporter permease [Halothiobacillus sp. DCM-1]|uniref:MlaE family ABC transporter permease n=1 Tax=Halothiobacillus sp. DCM-1 TaxID=3112558 RepID=UPI00325569CC
MLTQTDSSALPSAPPALHWQPARAGNPATLCFSGRWTAHGLSSVPPLPVPADAQSFELTADGLTLDAAGALVMSRWIQAWTAAGREVSWAELPDQAQALLALMAERLVPLPEGKPVRENFLAQIGRAVVSQWHEASAFLAFLGELVVRGLPLLLFFWRIRWRSVFAEIDAGGVRALGIVGLLSFLIGMVMAYQGGATLSNYGANVLIVNLVSIITLREMGPLLAAIIVAGRTGSSYTAQLGTMRITEEIDALRSLGLSPFEMLVFPKVIALVIALPLLSVFADVLGLLGGAVVANFGYGVPFSIFFERIPEAVTATTLMLGLVKAPVFAVVIALIGCMQGMRVRGSAAAVGKATTISVVQAIFMVIIIDAVFSVLFNLMGY